MTDCRTDLALECCESLPSKKENGIKTSFFTNKKLSLTKIEITDKAGALLLGKPVGTYITAEFSSLTEFNKFDDDFFSYLGEQLSSLLPKKGTVLIAGLGNRNITPDALGPESCSFILPTRHIGKDIQKSTGLGALRPVAVTAPGVLGQTGVETAEIIHGLVNSLSPCAVIVIDAFAARKLSRLGSTIQISDSGIVPGSGVGNSRSEISKNILGVPVISIGIPTVVDALTLANDIMQNNSESKNGENMIITPREIDLVISRGAKLIGMIINKALQPDISVSEMLELVSAD